jgi:hypothetical protein
MSEQANTTTILEAVLAMDAYYVQAGTGDWSLALTKLFSSLTNHEGELGTGTVTDVSSVAEQTDNDFLAIAHRGYVIENGRVVMCASGIDLLKSEEIAARCLGVGTGTQAAGALRDKERVVNCGN